MLIPIPRENYIFVIDLMKSIIIISIGLFIIFIACMAKTEGFKTGSGNACKTDNECVSNQCLVNKICM